MTQRGAPWNLAAISHKAKINFDSQDRHEYLYEPPAGNPTYAYVVDTGVELDHEEFGGRAYLGFDATHNKQGESDKKHGTLIASIIGGKKCGIAKNVTIVDVNFAGADLEKIHQKTVARAVTWAVEDIVKKGRVGQSVIATSWGWHEDEKFKNLIHNAVRYAEEEGILFVAAAGNSGIDSKVIFPANIKSAITVGAVGKDYERVGFSNAGEFIDFWAPGFDIEGADSSNLKGTRVQSGTSFASPHVAGVIAYLLDVEGPRSKDEIWKRIKALGTDQDVDDLDGAPDRFLFNGNQEAIAKEKRDH